MKTVQTLSTIEVLQNIDDGGTLEELRDAISQVSKAVDARNGTGKVTLELTFSREGRAQLSVTDKVKVTLPPIKKDKTIFFSTPDGQLSRNDTRQGELEIIGSDL